MTRSEIMRRVKRKNTPQELSVRKHLFEMGYRYRINVTNLPGSPDIAIKSKRKAIFVHGCFWHRHDCHLATTPKTNKDFWIPKFEKNIDRDKRKEEALKAMGWKIMVVWQCDIEKTAILRRRLKKFIGEPSSKKLVT